MPKVNEIPISTIDSKTKQLLAQVIPANEGVLIVCYWTDSTPYLYVVTERRAARIKSDRKSVFGSVVDALSPSVESSIVVQFEDIVLIKEIEFGRSLFGPASYAISLFGNDMAQALIGFSFPAKNDLYYKFVKTLRDAYEKCKALRESSSTAQSQRSSATRLRELDRLLQDGLITQVEHTQKRGEILRGL